MKDNGPFDAGALERAREGPGASHRLAARPVGFFPTSKIRIGAQAKYVNTYANRPQYGNNIYSPVTLLEFRSRSSGSASIPIRCTRIRISAWPRVASARSPAIRQVRLTRSERRARQRESSMRSARTVTSRRSTSQYTPMPTLNFTSTVGVDYNIQTITQFQPFGYNVDGVIGDNVFGDKGIYDDNNRQITVDLKGNWTRDFGSSFNSAFVTGVQGFLTKVKQPGSYGYDFPGPGIARTDAAGNQFASDGIIETVNGGYFVQEQLGYKNWLFVTGGARYDYSSAFGKDGRWRALSESLRLVRPSDLQGSTCRATFVAAVARRVGAVRSSALRVCEVHDVRSARRSSRCWLAAGQPREP